jgi:hypothetical protein
MTNSVQLSGTDFAWVGPSSDPERFSTIHACRVADSETLLAAYAEAQRVYNTCGGHKLADRMAHAMDLIAAELHDRNIPL